MMTDNVRFRLAQPSDLSTIADLRWRLQTDDEEVFDAGQKAQFIDNFVQLLLAEDSTETAHWLAVIKDQVVSVMSVRIVKKLPKPSKLDGRWGYLTNAYTLMEFRQQGIGADLLNVIKTWALNEDLELLIVWPSDRAYPLYERAGFARHDDPLMLDLETS